MLHAQPRQGLASRSADFCPDVVIAVGEVRYHDVELMQAGTGDSGKGELRVRGSDADGGLRAERRGSREHRMTDARWAVSRMPFSTPSLVLSASPST